MFELNKALVACRVVLAKTKRIFLNNKKKTTI